MDQLPQERLSLAVHSSAISEAVFEVRSMKCFSGQNILTSYSLMKMLIITVLQQNRPKKYVLGSEQRVVDILDYFRMQGSG